MRRQIQPATVKSILEVFDRLDYKTLGPIYCYEGGDEFWRAKRKPCERLGINLSQALLKQLPPGGRSLYVGAGVAELPVLLAEAIELQRQVEPYNLRRSEVTVLNHACRGTPVKLRARSAAQARGLFDHLWIVSVLNDPERFPDLSPLSYGNANPVTFNPGRFEEQRRIVRSIVDQCMPKLGLPGLVTTSTEEVVWIADWCHRHRIPYRVERKQYPTALVGDPICFIKVGKKRRQES
ncbi:MAG: hypothetical protein K2Q17_10625 [Nitrospiraceae bacterium]|jgi:hypothetical protein|uniref:hypothetical protein n=1 Tax=Nitrospira cf. moscoviensis SBR1015 TaxID=96242 RepID=UPI000A0D3476|nr:hypothetical protein [Nitrospira cf. moscoviensis SBR1015]MBY0248108.1 hypothetical protein [Nitrospiraceae bacterium]OQW31435.1 MAG: hypothetical protein A4E20_03890 [Nitrospira sp. SG-bin2]